MAKINKKVQQMQGWPTEHGYKGSGAEAWGTGIPSQHNLTVADDNLPAKFHLDPFSRFAGIHISVQFEAKKRRGGSR